MTTSKGKKSEPKGRKTTGTKPPKRSESSGRKGKASASKGSKSSKAAKEPPSPNEQVKSPQAQAAPGVSSDSAALLEDWTPLGRCLDWRVGLQAWAHQGDALIDTQQIPNLTHDSGSLSQRSAEVLAAWCDAQGDDLPDEVRLVELGMGTGLHLRFMLRRFAELAEGKDWLSRLHVYATDVNRGLLDKATERRLFEGSGAKVTLGGMNVMDPGRLVPLDGAPVVELGGQIHMYVANYVLDLLPFDLLRRSPKDQGSQWEAALARTWLVHPERLPAYTDLSLEQLKQAIASHRYDLVADVFPLIQVELRTFPFDVHTHEDKELLIRVADLQEESLGAEHPLLSEGTLVYHSAGALSVAERMVESLAPRGVALIRDVAMHRHEDAATPRTYQHYGPTASAGVNFVELDACFGQRQDPEGAQVWAIKPLNDGPRQQASRLLCADRQETVERRFSEVFDASTFEPVQELMDRAIAASDASAKMELYREALVLEPVNWVLMMNASQVALEGGLDPEFAAMLLRRALQLNGEHSADLWSLYGDALWATGERDGARMAYGFALDIHPGHALARYGRAYCEAERGRFDAALKDIGEALAGDPQGLVRARALQLLDACLRGQSNRHEAERRMRANRATR